MPVSPFSDHEAHKTAVFLSFMSHDVALQDLPQRNLFVQRNFADSLSKVFWEETKMKKLALSASMFSLLATTAIAGGIDRSGQWITPIFESGDVVTFSVGTVSPSVSGTGIAGVVGPTSESARRFNPVSFSIKKTLTEKVDVAVIVDQPFGANIKYTDGVFALSPIGPYAGGYADVSSKAMTFVGRYKFNNNFSVHAGARAQSMTGTIASGNGILNASGDYAWGGLIGAAYERPDIAMRIALTYNTSISNKLDGTRIDPLGAFSFVDATHQSPESLNLEFQTGIAKDTLLFGSVRHVKWKGSSLDSTPVGGGAPTNWVNFRDDSTSLTLGVGRKINDKLSLALTLGYEAAGTRPSETALAPTTGYKSIGLGASYNVNESLKITGGVQYIKLGDQSVETRPGVLPNINMSGDAVAFGVKVAYSF
jgi:long-chain fatty acid transport protein